MAGKTMADKTNAAKHTLVGPDARGHWVVRDEAGLYGGVFLDRERALRFAAEEGRQHLPRRDKIVLVKSLSL